MLGSSLVRHRNQREPKPGILRAEETSISKLISDKTMVVDGKVRIFAEF
jgi:hypothetical protein